MSHLHDRTRRVIRADGTEEVLPKALRDGAMADLIGAKVTTTVNLRHMGQPLMVMIVDDKGYDTEAVETPREGYTEIQLKPTKALKPVNFKATALYHANTKPGTTHQIVGDVIIVPDDDFAGPGRGAL